MGSENSADHACALVSSWFAGAGVGAGAEEEWGLGGVGMGRQ